VSVAVGLFGLDVVGQLVAEALVSAGVGTLLLADPARQAQAVLDLPKNDTTNIRLAPVELSRTIVEELAGDLDLMLVTFDRAFLVARHWANRAALATGCPALFIDVSLLEAVVGPTVLPGETGCYLCLRMRHLATSDNFEEVMAHEQFLDAKRDPQASRPLFPGLAEIAAGLAVAEATRLLFGPLVPALANAVTIVKPAEASIERHSVLRQPDCPHCRGVDKAVRSGG
jgi:ribosomal protein S12 methylthiotransferase accessory factor